MKVQVLRDAKTVAQKAAAMIAEEAWEAIAARGLFVMAMSGGQTPWAMLRELAGACVPWRAVHVVQVDERIAPWGHGDRNLMRLRESLISSVPIPPDQIYAMPVESADLSSGAAEYAQLLKCLAGSPPVLDLVHLGLGADGHTASLVPGDSVLDIANADVAVTASYQGRRRMTLTYPILNRARRILWVVTGGEKAAMVNRLLTADRAIPAGRLRRDRATVLVDSAGAPYLYPLERGDAKCA